MADPSRDLDRECDNFCTYLIGRGADDYVRARYRAAHESGSPEGDGRWGEFDRFLAVRAGASPTAASQLDALASLFLRNGLLRRKLILLLAILESSGSTHLAVDSPTVTGRAAFAASAVMQGLGFGLRAVVAGLRVGPAYLAHALFGRGARS